TAALIDEEVRRLIDEAEHRAHDILTEHLDELHRLAEALLEYETLTGDEVKKAMRGEVIPREDDSGSTPTEGSGRKASVPDAGKGRKPKGSPGGFGPEPQPES
ncbi:MAG: cell division protein FtsH, partial [Rhodospirillales bacterium]